jgi:hypothetical protein
MEFFPHNIPIRLLYGIIPLEQPTIALASSSLILAHPRFIPKVSDVPIVPFASSDHLSRGACQKNRLHLQQGKWRR